jgi:hypothetical protein
MRPPASRAELLTVAEKLLNPRQLAGELVGATVQIAAVHAGIPPFAARLMGQAAKDWFASLSSPDPDAPEVRAMQYADLALSAKDRSLSNSSVGREIAATEMADAINRLLGPGAPPPRPTDGTAPFRETPVSQSQHHPDSPTSSSRVRGPSEPVPTDNHHPRPFSFGVEVGAPTA